MSKLEGSAFVPTEVATAGAVAADPAGAVVAAPPAGGTVGGRVTTDVATELGGGTSVVSGPDVGDDVDEPLLQAASSAAEPSTAAVAMARGRPDIARLTMRERLQTGAEEALKGRDGPGGQRGSAPPAGAGPRRADPGRGLRARPVAPRSRRRRRGPDGTLTAPSAAPSTAAVTVAPTTVATTPATTLAPTTTAPPLSP